jgi:hypothetical protein
MRWPGLDDRTRSAGTGDRLLPVHVPRRHDDQETPTWWQVHLEAPAAGASALVLLVHPSRRPGDGARRRTVPRKVVT